MNCCHHCCDAENLFDRTGDLVSLAGLLGNSSTDTFSFACVRMEKERGCLY